jgi:TP901 family phage tail tape measure protein
MARQFAIQGVAVINKIKIGANARRQLQNLVIQVNTGPVLQQLQQIQRALQAAFAPLARLGRAAGPLNNTARALGNIGRNANNANTAVKKTSSLFTQVIRKASAFRVSTIFINSFFNAIEKAIKFTIDFDSSLRDINKILKTNDTDLNSLGAELINVARAYGLTAEEVAKAGVTAAQAGFGTTAETLNFVSKAALIAATSTLKFEEAQSALISISRQTNQSIDEAATTIAKFSSIEDASAVEARDLAIVFEKAGTSISQAFGKNLDTAAGALAALLERTRQSPQVIGTFAKTIIARLGGANQDATRTFNELGISIEDATGKLKDPITLLREFQKALEGRSEADIGKRVGIVFGVRQVELGKALLEVIKDEGRGLELAGEASKGFSSQLSKLVEEQKKLAFTLNEIEQAFNALVNRLKEDIAIPAFDKLKSLGELLGSLSGKGVTGGTANVLSGLGLTGAVAVGGGLLSTLGFKRQNTKEQELQGVSNRQIAFNRVSNARAGTPNAVTGTQRAFFGISQNAKRVAASFQSLSAVGLASAAIINIVGDSFKDSLEAGTKSVNDSTAAWSKAGTSIISFTQQFANFALVFGAKAGFLLAALSVLAEEGPKARDAVKLWNDRVRSSTQTLEGMQSAIRVLEEAGDAGAARDIRVQETVNRGIRGQLTEDESTKLGKVLTDIFNEGANKFSDRLASARMANLDGTIKEAADAEVKALNDEIKEWGRTIIADIQQSSPEIAALIFNSTKIGFETFAKDIPAELKPFVKEAFSAISGNADRSGITNIGNAFNEVIATLGVKKGLETPSTRFTGLSDEDIEDRIELAKADAEVAKSINELISATRTWVAANYDSVASIKAEGEAQKQLSQIKIKTLQTERQALIEQERTAIEATIKNTQQDIKNQRALIASPDIKGGKEANLEQISELELKLIDLGRTLQKINSGEFSTDKLESNLRAVAALQIEVGNAELTRVREEYNTISDITSKRINDVEELKNATFDLEASERALKQSRANATAVDIAREELEAQRRINRERLISLDAELLAIRLIERAGLDAQRASLEGTIRNVENAPVGGPQEQAQLVRLREELKSIIELQEKSSKKEQSLVLERDKLVLSSRKEEIDKIRQLIEAERNLSKERLSAASKLIDLTQNLKESTRAVFEAQKGLSDAIKAKFEEASQNIKDKRGALDQAFASLASARDSLISALGSGADAFAQFTLEVEKASVAAEKVMGSFFGLKDEASALAAAYTKVIDSARAAGASETQLAQLRQEAAQDQLALFEDLLNEQRSKAEKFFLSSAEDRVNFVQGLASIQQVVGQFGGNIQNFRGMSETQLNEFGRTLISLPQDIRQNMLNALEQLPNGVGVGGLTADQIKEVLLGGAFGESEELGIESLSEVMQQVADLTRQVASLGTSQLVEARKNISEQQAAVAEAKEGVTIAKSMLNQAKADALKIQSGIAKVSQTVDSQIGSYKEIFQQKINEVLASDETALQKQERIIQILTDANAKFAEILRNTASAVGTVGPGTDVNNLSSVSLPTGVVGPGQSGRDILNNISQALVTTAEAARKEFEGLTTVINGNLLGGLASTTDSLEKLTAEMIKLAGRELQTLKATVDINQQTEVKLVGVDAIVTEVVNAIRKEGYASEEALDALSRTVSQMIRQSIESGTLKPMIR